MLGSGVRNTVSWAALGLMLAAGPFAAAWAEDAPVDRPAATVTPLDLSPPVARPPAADADLSPTGAIGLHHPPNPSSQSGVSRLDLSPPPGLLPDLPPESPLPALARRLSPRSSRPRRASVRPRPTGETEPLAPVAAPPQTVTPPPAASSLPESPTPETAPAVAAPAEPVADATAREIQTALDAFVAAKPFGRPIGAGDWSAARKAIAAVYAERAFAPLWIEGDHYNARARATLARLARAGEDGLDLAAPSAPAADFVDAGTTARRDPGRPRRRGFFFFALARAL